MERQTLVNTRPGPVNPNIRESIALQLDYGSATRSGVSPSRVIGSAQILTSKSKVSPAPDSGIMSKLPKNVSELFSEAYAKYIAIGGAVILTGVLLFKFRNKLN